MMKNKKSVTHRDLSKDEYFSLQALNRHASITGGFAGAARLLWRLLTQNKSRPIPELKDLEYESDCERERPTVTIRRVRRVIRVGDSVKRVLPSGLPDSFGIGEVKACAGEKNRQYMVSWPKRENVEWLPASLLVRVKRNPRGAK